MASLKPGRGVAPVDGGELVYLIAGEGPPIVSTHPTDTPKEGDRPLPGYSSITVWPRGFGKSSAARDNQDYGFWRLVEDLEAVRRHLELDKWVFFGRSQGAMTALLYAVEYPDAVSALILDSGAAASYHFLDEPNSIWPELRASELHTNLLKEPSWETYRAYRIRVFALNNRPNPEEWYERSVTSGDRNPFAYTEWLRRLPEFDIRSRLGRIRVPTLILSGENDRLWTARQTRVVAESIPGAILKVYPDRGHLVFASQPPGLMELVQEFLESALAKS